MKTDYENSELCRLGEMYKSMGEWLMNPNTTLRHLHEVASMYNIKLQFSIVPVDEQQEQSE